MLTALTLAAAYLLIGAVLGTIAVMTLPFQTNPGLLDLAGRWLLWFVGWGPLLVVDLVRRAK